MCVIDEDSRVHVYEHKCWTWQAQALLHCLTVHHDSMTDRAPVVLAEFTCVDTHVYIQNS